MASAIERSTPLGENANYPGLGTHSEAVSNKLRAASHIDWGVMPSNTDSRIKITNTPNAANTVVLTTFTSQTIAMMPMTIAAKAAIVSTPIAPHQPAKPLFHRSLPNKTFAGVGEDLHVECLNGAKLFCFVLANCKV